MKALLTVGLLILIDVGINSREVKASFGDYCVYEKERQWPFYWIENGRIVGTACALRTSEGVRVSVDGSKIDGIWNGNWDGKGNIVATSRDSILPSQIMCASTYYIDGKWGYCGDLEEILKSTLLINP